MSTQPLWSVGEIAEQTSTPLHRIIYAISSRSIKPVMTAGGRRLFDASGFAEIESALRAIDARKEAHHESL